MTHVKVTYTANAGVIVEVGNTSVILDGLNRAENLVYANTPDSLASQITKGSQPYDRIDAMLYTHLHDDHFSASMTESFMESHQNAKLLIGIDALEELKSRDSFQTLIKSRQTTLLKGETETIFLSDKLTVNAFKTKHMGKEYEGVLHFAFLIEIEGVNVLFLGDTDTIVENFDLIINDQKPIDLLVTPFPYLSTTRGQGFITQIIKPKRVVTVHIPPIEKDTYKWYEATFKMYENHMKGHTPAIFAREFGHVYHVEF